MDAFIQSLSSHVQDLHRGLLLDAGRAHDARDRDALREVGGKIAQVKAEYVHECLVALGLAYPYELAADSREEAYMVRAVAADLEDSERRIDAAWYRMLDAGTDPAGPWEKMTVAVAVASEGAAALALGGPLGLAIWAAKYAGISGGVAWPNSNELAEGLREFREFLKDTMKTSSVIVAVGVGLAAVAFAWKAAK